MLRFLQSAWRSQWLPEPVRARLRPLANRTILSLAGRPATELPPVAVGPVVITGFFNETLGIGRAARLTADALEAAGVEVIRQDARILLDQGKFRSETLPGGPGGVWLLHCNPDEAAIVMARFPPAQWKNRYRIGYWAYELSTAPAHWIEFSENYHELWAPSRFTADALAGADCPVTVQPHPPPAISERPARSPDGKVRFLTFADLRSSAARKNPMGAIDAFRQAFPEEQSDAILRVKLVHSETHPREAAKIAAKGEGRADIEIVTEDYSDQQVLDLIAAHDVFISLHRSEGFGLAILEAMSLGRAVIATGWSGSLEFTADMPEALVGYQLVPVEDPSGIYPTGSHWAEPDLSEAAQLIRRLAADASFRNQLAQRGREGAIAIGRHWEETRLSGAKMMDWVRQKTPAAAE